MRIANDTLLNSSSPVVVSGNWESEPILLSSIQCFNIQISFDSASAVIILQCSNDDGNSQKQKPTNYTVKNWTDIDYSSTAINGSGTGVFDVSDVGYRWVRVAVLGSVNILSLRYNGKGV